MATYDEKQEKVLDKIAATIKDLDSTVADYTKLSVDGKSHSFREWIDEKKAIHEIKKALREVGKYDDNAEGQFDKELSDISDYVKSVQSKLQNDLESNNSSKSSNSSNK
ncbi:hypothetical protein [Floricoccus penangensis]|uniref:Uncharacterized protein n=1 Tax=Floricoccus penangensis TaxID=1859475 RepID=A0A9Q5JHY5_9LACT|nr:hypothetical protein [Floricoccus penangensis]OFI47650.1 hypothetical protein BG262_08070 [Floricoccus penangensis]URZ88342.1 hypothetical protein KIW23_04725 [Floricoccus penangensis]